MAINKNHEFEELNGVKCGIVEKNVSPERVKFLTALLELNGFTVVAAPTPPPKLAPPPVPKEGDPPVPAPPPAPPASASAAASTDKPETFTLGVTDYTFNWVNAIFGRLLKTKDGHIVTLAYWHQQETASHDEIPYYEHE
jgi:hypothetical protein